VDASQAGRGGRDGAGQGQAVPPALPLGFATVDLDRPRRQGLPEVVYAPGKQPAEIATIAAALLNRTSGPVLVTRLEPGAAAEVAGELAAARGPGAEVAAGSYDARARLLCWRPARPDGWRVAVVTAGTADGPVADEAAAVARATGLQVAEFRDVGVAGLHRLLAVREQIASADCLVVVAGMEGALPSVVGGLVGVPLVAVPTSVGYGASFGGLAALLAMLNSCAPGVVVVNIDNGFGAGVFAARVARRGGRPTRAGGGSTA